MASVALALEPSQLPSQQRAQAGPPVAPERPRVQRASASLSALEWSVVALAERDTLASLREPSRLSAALGSLFGLRRPNKLANLELEALRRLAVHAWRNSWNVPSSEIESFLAAGFTLDQYELIQTSIHKGRAALRRQRRGA